MKKALLVLFAVAAATVSQAQFVLGLQGGYYWQENSTSLTADKTTSSYAVGGLQAGYKVLPNLYVGVMGGYVNTTTDTLAVEDVYFYSRVGMNIDVKDHKKHLLREGWFVAPQVKWEFLRFGNMHFNLMLQGSLRMLGPNKYTESYISVSYPNPNEYREEEPWDNHTSDMTWGVSLRPTLVYEISEHLSAELMLDLLSVGFISETETYDPEIEGVEPVERKTRMFYAGLNSFTDVLRWENTLLKLGFNWTF
ncbi:MAG: hypothetical protein IJ745_08650 [Bacteroidales bacterium]|nr:hypothetical protein [Bacteroidales bacterium]